MSIEITVLAKFCDGNSLTYRFYWDIGTNTGDGCQWLYLGGNSHVSIPILYSIAYSLWSRMRILDQRE